MSEGPTFHSPSCLPETQHKKDDNGKLEFSAVGKERFSISGSSASSFSGFSSSTSNSESSDDVSSVSESVNSVEPDNSDGHLSVDGAIDMLQTSFRIPDMCQSKPSSPKFASLVNSANGFPKLSKQNQSKSGSSDGVGRCKSTCSSGLHTNLPNGPNAVPCSCFWGSTLESFGSPGNTHNDSDTSDSNGDGNSKLSDSGPRTSLHFSFNLSGHSSPPLHAHGSEAKGVVSVDALPDALSTNKTTNKATLSENTGLGLPTTRDSQSLNCEVSDNVKDDSKSISHNFKSRESKPVPLCTGVRIDSSNDIGVPFTSAAKLDNVINDCSRMSNTSKTREAGCLLPSGSDARLASGVTECLVASVKTRKDDPVEAVVSSQVSNSSSAKNGLKTSVRKVVEQFRGSKMSKNYPFGDGSEIAGRYTDKVLILFSCLVSV